MKSKISKASLKVLNNTKYFNPASSRLYNRFINPSTYRSRQIKIEGYESRLYWQYRYCEDHNGQTFYYTLTYNDKSVPKFCGINCFDYDDLRYLLTGGFYQYLRRNYGTKFKYFVGAELGDGKGERGMHNNPHYHVLFFLYPDDSPLSPYAVISPADFRHLVRLYWQGFDEDLDGYHDYCTAKFGIAKEGDNCGLVTDFRACMYCAKYVTKDAYLIRSESHIKDYIKFYNEKVYKDSPQSFLDFYAANTDIFDSHRLSLMPQAVFDLFESVDGKHVPFTSPSEARDMVLKLDMYNDYLKFCEEVIQQRINEAVKEFRNRYTNKCRISNGVGLYSLNFIKDKNNPSVAVPSKYGFKYRPLPLYLFRKLYTTTVQTVHQTRLGKLFKYDPVRVLNADGIDYKVHNLQKCISKLSVQAEGLLNTVVFDNNLFDSIRQSPLNTYCNYTYDSFRKEFDFFSTNNLIPLILNRYAIFKLVYEDRFFPFQSDRTDSFQQFPSIDLLGDYRRFLTPGIYKSIRSSTAVSSFLESDFAGHLPYSLHPYFLPYIGFFNFLDMCTDYFFVQNDDKAHHDAEEIAAVKRFHDKRKLVDFYKQFKTNLL